MSPELTTRSGRPLKRNKNKDDRKKTLSGKAATLELSLLRAALESTSDGIVITDVRFRGVVWNQRFRELFSIPDPLLDTRDPLAMAAHIRAGIVDPGDFDARSAELRRHPEDPTVALFTFRDGRTMERRTRPQYLGDRCIGIAFIWRDVSAQMQAAEELRQSEDRFRAVVDSAPDAIFIQTGGRFAYVNPATVALLREGSAEQLIGTPVEDRFAPEFRDIVRRRISQLNADRAHVPPLHEQLLRADGSRVDIEAVGFPFRFGGADGALVFARDITERLRAEHERQRFTTHLEQLVDERTGELQASNRELAAFTHSVSHDLRSPLRGIEAWTVALLEDCAANLDEQGRQHLDRIRHETQRMSQLIDDLLKLSRISQHEMQVDEVDLSALAREILARIRQSGELRDVDVRIEDGLSADGDAGLLRIALTNLLENAWKFTSRCTKARIEVGCEELDGERTFYVRDNGAGFDMTFAGRLFSPFQRMHRASEFPGNGVGLATVQRIVARHGGRIWVDAAPGRGAAFRFTLRTQRT